MSTNPIIHANGTQKWRNEDGKLHRINGPAVIYASGSQAWYVNGEWHRTDGPAVMYANGIQRWFVNGTYVRTRKEYQKAAKLSDEEMTMLVLKYGDIK